MLQDFISFGLRLSFSLVGSNLQTQIMDAVISQPLGRDRSCAVSPLLNITGINYSVHRCIGINNVLLGAENLAMLKLSCHAA